MARSRSDHRLRSNQNQPGASMTRLVRIGIAGGLLDAFVYRTQLYAIGVSGDLRIYEVSDIERTLRETLGEIGDAAAYYMFHTHGQGATRSQLDSRAGLALHGNGFLEQI